MIYIYIYFSYTTTKMFVFTWLGLSLSVPSALCNTVTGVSKRTFRLYPRVSMMEPVRIGLTEVSVVPRGHAETALCFTAPREADHTSPGTLQQESWPHPHRRAGPTPYRRRGRTDPDDMGIGELTLSPSLRPQCPWNDQFS